MRMIAVIFTACLFCVGESQARDTLFVSSAVQTPGDGRSWEHAFTTLHDAVRIADLDDEVWVAKGTYVVGSEGINISRTIKLYGGFKGGEVRREFRDWRLNRTVIQAQSNAAPVLTITGASEQTEIDGFFVQGAPHRAFLIDGSRCIISNTTFRGNTAMNGGAVLIVKDAQPTFRFCVFENNTSQFSGGAIFIEGASGFFNTSAAFQNCVFANNTSGTNGGAVSVEISRVPVSFSSTVFYQNQSAKGGAVSIEDAEATVSHCTMFNNASLGMSNQGRSIHSRGASTLELRNSILWSDGDSPLPHLFVEQNLGPQPYVKVDATIIQRDFFRGTWQADPLFTQPDRPSGFDRVWGTADDGLQLKSVSDGIDKAAFHTDDLQIYSDVTSRPRSSMVRSDLGAYERQRTQYVGINKARSLLESGNVVLLFRNAPTALRNESTPASCLDALSLSDEGRKRLTGTQEALKANAPAVSESRTATTCVSWETALALAGFIDMDSVWNVGAKGDLSGREADILRPIGAGPRIIVAEQPVIREVLGFELHEIREGDALLFDNAEGSLSPIAQITMDGWRLLGLEDVPTSVYDPSLAVTKQQPELVRGAITLRELEVGIVIILDARGQTIYEAACPPNSMISTVGWAPGLYLIRTVSQRRPILLMP